ncbi:restriction endonuclease subunit S [Vibrio alginolyticus]
MSKVMLLKDCCEFQEGYVNPSQKDPSYFGGEIKWLRASDLNGGHVYNTERTLSKKGYKSAGKSAKLFKKGTLAISKSGTIGALGILEDDMCGNRAVINISVDKSKADLKYVFYTLKYKKEELISKAGGSIQKNLYVSALETLSLNHDVIEEQRRISSVLSSIDDKIEINNRVNAELEAMAKTLYDYWFVQFDFPDASGKPYKASGGKMVYDPTLKRDVPDEWEVTTVGKIAKTELGGTPSTAVDEYWNDADIPWLSSAETASFPVTTSEQKITQAGIDNSAATLLPKGTVIISIVRYIRPSILGIDAATNQSVVGIRECKRLKSSFIYPYFCSEVPRLMGLRTGAQQPHINKGVIEKSPIVIPSDKALTDYYKVADPIFEKIMNLAFQNQELMQLRDWLLPMLMNGQVTVKPSTESPEAQHG